jgi:hypothetical protein
MARNVYQYTEGIAWHQPPWLGKGTISNEFFSELWGIPCIRFRGNAWAASWKIFFREISVDMKYFEVM